MPDVAVVGRFACDGTVAFMKSTSDAYDADACAIAFGQFDDVLLRWKMDVTEHKDVLASRFAHFFAETGDSVAPFLALGVPTHDSDFAALPEEGASQYAALMDAVLAARHPQSFADDCSVASCPCVDNDSQCRFTLGTVVAAVVPDAGHEYEDYDGPGFRQKVGQRCFAQMYADPTLRHCQDESYILRSQLCALGAEPVPTRKRTPKDWASKLTAAFCHVG